MTQPAPERTTGTRCGVMLGSGFVNYPCTLRQGHEDAGEPHYAVEVPASARAWQAWARQEFERERVRQGETQPEPDWGEAELHQRAVSASFVRQMAEEGGADGRPDRREAVREFVEDARATPAPDRDEGWRRGDRRCGAALDLRYGQKTTLPPGTRFADWVREHPEALRDLPYSYVIDEDGVLHEAQGLPRPPLLDVKEDRSVPPDEVHLRSGEQVVARIRVTDAPPEQPSSGVEAKASPCLAHAPRCGYWLTTQLGLHESRGCDCGAAESHAAEAQQGLRQRPGDQPPPDGDESTLDDQSLVISDLLRRREVGIGRYGQAHRPFNGRNTLQDAYEETLDLAVYLRSLLRAREADWNVLTRAAERALEKADVRVEEGDHESGGQRLAAEVVVRAVLDALTTRSGDAPQR